MRKPIPALRLGELGKLIKHRHMKAVPATEDAILYLEFAAHNLAHMPGRDLLRKLQSWSALWTPSIATENIEEVAASVGRRPRILDADRAARALGVTVAERDELGVRTIGAIGTTKAEREARAKARRLIRDAAQKAKKRHSAGALAREAYEALSVTRAKPWERLGISRSKWYRDQNAEQIRETSVSPHNSPSYPTHLDSGLDGIGKAVAAPSVITPTATSTAI